MERREERILLYGMLGVFGLVALLLIFHPYRSTITITRPVTPSNVTTAVAPCNLTFGNGKLAVSVNNTSLSFNTTTGALKGVINVSLANVGQDAIHGVYAVIYYPGTFEYYVNSIDSYWSSVDNLTVVGSSGRYIEAVEIKPTKREYAEYTLVISPSTPAGTYHAYLVVFALHNASEETAVQTIPITITVS